MKSYGVHDKWIHPKTLAELPPCAKIVVMESLLTQENRMTVEARAALYPWAYPYPLTAETVLAELQLVSILFSKVQCSPKGPVVNDWIRRHLQFLRRAKINILRALPSCK